MTVAGLLGLAAVQGCSSDSATTPQDPRFVGIVVKPDSMIINVGLQGHLEVWMVDTTGDLVFPPSKVSYHSHNSSLAHVDADGFVQAGNNPGTTTITVSSGGFSVDHPVRVGYLPWLVTISPRSVLLAPNQSQALTLHVLDQSGREMTNPPITFTATTPNLFSVSSQGLITSAGPAGAGMVRVQVENFVEHIPVSVGGFPARAVAHTTAAGHSMYQAAVTASGRMVVTGRDGAIAARGTLPSFELPSSVVTGTMPLGLAVNQAGTRAYIASVGQLTVIDLDNDVALTPIPIAGGGDKLSVVLSHDETQAYVGTANGVYVVNLANRQILDSIATGGATFMALHPTKPLLYVSQVPVREIDLSTMKITPREFGPFLMVPKGIAVSPEGTELLVVDEDDLRIFDFASVKQIQMANLDSRGDATGLAVSSQLITVTTGNGVRVFDRVTRYPISTVQVGGVPKLPAISPDGSTIVVPNENGNVDFIQ